MLEVRLFWIDQKRPVQTILRDFADHATLENGILKHGDAIKEGREEERAGNEEPELMNDHPDGIRDFARKLPPGLVARGISIDHSSEGVENKEGRHPSEPLSGFRGHKDHVFVNEAGQYKNAGHAIQRIDTKILEGRKDASMSDIAEKHIPAATPKVSGPSREEGRVTKFLSKLNVSKMNFGLA